MSADEMKLILKDTLRAARFTVRSSSVLPAPGAGPLTSLADSVLSQAEEAIRSVRGRRGPGTLGEALDVLAAVALGKSNPDDEGALRRSLYSLAQAILAERGIGNRFVAERALAEVARGHAGWTGTPDLLAARIVLAVRSAHPIRLAELPDERGADVARLNAETAIALGLAIATVARGPASFVPGDVIASAVVAAQAMEDRFETAFSSREGEGAVAHLLAAIAAHLP